MSASTKNLGKRKKVPVRVGPETERAAEEIANLVPCPVNTVYALGVVMLSAQFAPLIAVRGINLDLLQEEVCSLIEDARRVVMSKKAPPRKVPK